MTSFQNSFALIKRSPPAPQRKKKQKKTHTHTLKGANTIICDLCNTSCFLLSQRKESYRTETLQRECHWLLLWAKRNTPPPFFLISPFSIPLCSKRNYSRILHFVFVQRTVKTCQKRLSVSQATHIIKSNPWTTEGLKKKKKSVTEEGDGRRKINQNKTKRNNTAGTKGMEKGGHSKHQK